MVAVLAWHCRALVLGVVRRRLPLTFVVLAASGAPVIVRSCPGAHPRESVGRPASRSNSPRAQPEVLGLVRYQHSYVPLDKDSRRTAGDPARAHADASRPRSLDVAASDNRAFPSHAGPQQSARAQPSPHGRLRLNPVDFPEMSSGPHAIVALDGGHVLRAASATYHRQRRIAGMSLLQDA